MLCAAPFGAIPSCLMSSSCWHQSAHPASVPLPENNLSLQLLPWLFNTIRVSLAAPVASSRVTIHSVHHTSEPRSATVHKLVMKVTVEGIRQYEFLNLGVPSWSGCIIEHNNDWVSLLSPASIRQTGCDRRVPLLTLSEVAGSQTAVQINRPTRSVSKEARETPRRDCRSIVVPATVTRYLRHIHTNVAYKSSIRKAVISGSCFRFPAFSDVPDFSFLRVSIFVVNLPKFLKKRKNGTCGNHRKYPNMVKNESTDTTEKTLKKRKLNTT